MRLLLPRGQAANRLLPRRPGEGPPAAACAAACADAAVAKQRTAGEGVDLAGGMSG